MSKNPLKQTPLHQAHINAGGKMVDFGGWEMPLNYGSQIDEHPLSLPIETCWLCYQDRVDVCVHRAQCTIWKCGAELPLPLGL